MTVERQGRFRSVWVAAVGTTVVFGYTLLAVAQIFALNPAAAVPGVPLEQIRADMAAAGESMHAGLGIGIMAVGPLMALLLLVLAVRRTDATPIAIAVAYLVLLGFGPLAYFAAAFGPGMSLADTYGISGADYSPWALPLYAVSVSSLLALGIVGIATSARRRRGVA